MHMLPQKTFADFCIYRPETRMILRLMPWSQKHHELNNKAFWIPVGKARRGKLCWLTHPMGH